MAKTLGELLNKYIPNDAEAAILNSGIVSRSRVDKEKRCLEVYADFPSVISKERLYALEEAVGKAYDLRMCKIKPKYPSETFSFEYMKDILLETEREGIVARGFFGDYDYSVSGNVITLKIPFSGCGIDLLECANTPAVIESIIRSEFDLNYKVVIEQNGNNIMEMSNDFRSRLENIDRQIHSASERYTITLKAGENPMAPVSNEPRLPKLPSRWRMHSCKHRYNKPRRGSLRKSPWRWEYLRRIWRKDFQARR